MKAEKAATATISKHVQICRRLFAFALRKKHITENPFAFIKGGTQVNRDRLQFVEAATVQVLLDSLVDPEWRLCIALARWGGLRVPSEIRDLKWGDIVWDRNRFVVSCVKTSGHEGKGTRIVPIFPEIKPYLEDLYERAEPGLYVFPKLRMFRGMPKLLVDRILAAGILPWIKPWQNLRSTRATELADLFPSHVAAAWLGHSVAVSDRHYRQVTDDHFEKAVLRAAKSGAVTLQNPVQSANVSECPDLTRLTQDLKECDVSQSKTDNVIYVQTSRLGVTGFEPVTSTV
ncbi:tyrosine-type recombinase/integrase [Zavarzinella formosa]|uniref:tyrosine-type recombinase/integrase n=1 Tax=Zavarzinella formosa TaxID=360055 RepID=UPI0036F3E99F